MKKHDWRGGSSLQLCGNVGCSWIRLPRGVDGDPRIHYANGPGKRAVLRPRQCEGKALAEVEAES